MPTDTAQPTIEAGGSTDVGLRRRVNEDALFVEHPVYVVADGMGGHDAGDRASRAVIDAFRALGGASGVDADAVAVAVDRAHAAVRLIGDETAKGAGSTLVLVAVTLVDGRSHWLVAHVGDSRAYRLRAGVLDRLTVDHSLVQELVDSGQLRPEDVDAYGSRNVITRAIGADDSAADFALHPIVTGDRIILCSDGLHGEIADARIAELAGVNESAQAAADHLLAAALDAGGRDNVTVVVVDAVAGGSAPWLDEETVIGGDHLPAADHDAIDDDTLESPTRRSR